MINILLYCMNVLSSLNIGKGSSRQRIYHCCKSLILNDLLSNIHNCSKNVVKKDSNPMVSCALMSAPGTSKAKEGLE